MSAWRSLPLGRGQWAAAAHRFLFSCANPDCQGQWAHEARRAGKLQERQVCGQGLGPLFGVQSSGCVLMLDSQAEACTPNLTPATPGFLGGEGVERLPLQRPACWVSEAGPMAIRVATFAESVVARRSRSFSQTEE
jgi:hypothetical protein